ncbi:peroxiredoxin-like family protein [Pedobacter kyonggii]|uniref:thioredoxin-dependent peroxiredoxin n=1 Tax=Pedobacter kyonggii TaxID=1926871 RepID=A0A4Q9H9L0_9SPHI|nr:peroxiredoxin-like family protein [Pedobacter kyonggii]TBO40606.1 AhpC/TSA family protein [Pedobacter kyonggii]
MMIKNIFQLIPRKNGKVLTYNPFKLFPLLIDSYRFGTKYGSDLKLNTGDKSPDFNLPNLYGKNVNLYSSLEQTKVILIFYRGGWCPFCNLQLRQYQNMTSQFNEYGAKIIAISPEIPDRELTDDEKTDLKFEVLSDVGNSVAKKFTGILKYEGKSAERLRELGIDLNELNQSESREVPIPAVFIIDQNRKIIFAKSEGGDYKKRVEPQEVLALLKG